MTHPKLGQIYMLHRVEPLSPDGKSDPLTVSPDFLCRFLDTRLKQGAEFIGIGEVPERICDKRKGFVCLTFDDGYLDNLTQAYPLLRERHIPFCLYLTSDYILGRATPAWNPGASMLSPSQVKQLAADPLCTIGAHTRSHPRLDSLSYEAQESEIKDGKMEIEGLVGKPVEHFAYPHGDYDSQTVEILRRLGFRTAVTCSGRNLRRDSQPLELDRVFVGDR